MKGVTLSSMKLFIALTLLKIRVKLSSPSLAGIGTRDHPLSYGATIQLLKLCYAHVLHILTRDQAFYTWVTHWNHLFWIFASLKTEWKHSGHYWLHKNDEKEINIRKKTVFNLLYWKLSFILYLSICIDSEPFVWDSSVVFTAYFC